MDENVVLIYGKDGWPHTRAAREAVEREGSRAEYRNVTRSKAWMDELERLAPGRRVPVVVRGKEVTVGWDGGTWGV